MHLAKDLVVVVDYIKMTHTAKELNQMKHNKPQFFFVQKAYSILVSYVRRQLISLSNNYTIYETQ